ncbi:MAG TPA: amidohydrolase family protein [Polyangiaceae bacterium]|nr:amidohydrolase family protein [Polyangiaceae bacterium]
MIRALHATAVVPGDAPSFLDGALVLDDEGRVLDVGRADAVLPRHAGARVQRVDGVVFPGLVNAHTHLELSALRGRVPSRPDLGFAGWAEAMLAARADTAPESAARAIDGAVRELVAHATVAVGDVSNTLASVAALGEHGLVGSVFHEVFGADPEAAVARVSRLAAEARALRWPAGLTWAPSPHALHTLHPEGVRAVLALARSVGARASLHLAEDAAEREVLVDGCGPMRAFLAARGVRVEAFPWPGCGPTEYAARLGALAEDVALVHLVDARPAELARVAEAGAPVVLCPRSNAWIGGHAAPVAALLTAGVEPALGTDSLASCRSLDVLEEAALLRHRGAASAERLVRMATYNGAKVLGIASLGRLARGARPGVFAVLGALDDAPAEWLLAHAGAPRVRLDRRAGAAMPAATRAAS